MFISDHLTAVGWRNQKGMKTKPRIFVRKRKPLRMTTPNAKCISEASSTQQKSSCIFKSFTGTDYSVFSQPYLLLKDLELVTPGDKIPAPVVPGLHAAW